MKATHLAAIAVLFAPTAIVACSEDPPPKVPTTPVVAGSNPTPNKPQIGMSDAPSSARLGDTPAVAPRPALTGQASGLYQQALQAFAKGDLHAAKGLFEQATQAEPRSHQAFASDNRSQGFD